MEKPASVRRMDLRQTIVESINNSQLPPYVVAPLLSDILTEVNRNVELQYKQDLARWKDSEAEHHG